MNNLSITDIACLAVQDVGLRIYRRQSLKVTKLLSYVLIIRPIFRYQETLPPHKHYWTLNGPQSLLFHPLLINPQTNIFSHTKLKKLQLGVTLNEVRKLNNILNFTYTPGF